MATDYWSSQERAIVSGFEVAFVTASGTIHEGDILTFSMTASTDSQTDGVVTMEVAAAAGAGKGVALKAASDGEIMPVMFYGVHKFKIAGVGTGGTLYQIYAGSLVINSGTSHDVIIATKKYQAYTAGSGLLNFFYGNSTVLGMAMQGGDTDNDEILVLVGRGP